MAIKQFKPILLKKNITYPTYQLYATVNNTDTAPTDALKICILHTLEWMREKFRAFETPEPLIAPAPAEYEKFSLDSLSSFSINEGYSVDSVWLPDLNSWSIQLVEPDISGVFRAPVPGRVFTTNIGFHIVDNIVHCGFQTLVSDPEDCKEVCDVFRPAVVKHIARNKQVGLRQVRTLIEHPRIIDTYEQIRSLREFIRSDSRTLPIAVFTYATDSSEPEDKIEEITKSKPVISVSDLRRSPHVEYNQKRFEKQFSVRDGLTERMKNLPDHPLAMINSRENDPAPKQTAPVKAEPAEKAEPFLPYELDELSHDKMGYGYVAVVTADKLEEFNKVMGLELCGGDVLLTVPERFGAAEVFPYKKHRRAPEMLLEKIGSIIQTYSLNKPVEFPNVIFSTKARLHQQELIISGNASVEEILRQQTERENTLIQQGKEQVRKVEEQLALRDEKVRRLNEQIEQHNSELAVMRLRLDEEKNRHEEEKRQLEQKIAYLISREERPDDISGVIAWAQERFGDTIIFHDRAVEKLEKLSTPVDVMLLCDCLEYLATEYYRFYTKQISESERDRICSEKYNRPIEVAPSGAEAIKNLPLHYKVKYDFADGSPRREVALDMHLRIGVATPFLIRIYFFYDKVSRKFVIGSLPEHLPTLSNKT